MIRRLLILLLWAALAPPAFAAELVVAVRSDSEIGTLSRNEVIDIFLGRFRQLPSGQRAEPLDLAAQSPEREAFYHSLINKTGAEINAYWARLLFTGRVTAPKVMDSPEKVLEELIRNPRAIGYLERSRMDRCLLRIVFEITTP